MKKLLTMLVVLLVISLSSFKQERSTFNIRESINTLEDMKEWMMYDIDQNDVNRSKGEIYIENLDEVIKRLQSEIY